MEQLNYLDRAIKVHFEWNGDAIWQLASVVSLINDIIVNSERVEAVVNSRNHGCIQFFSFKH